MDQRIVGNAKLVIRLRCGEIRVVRALFVVLESHKYSKTRSAKKLSRCRAALMNLIVAACEC